MVSLSELNLLDSLFDLLNRIPELFPELDIPGVESVTIAVYILALCLLWWLIKLIILEG
jgi:hypothetical protein